MRDIGKEDTRKRGRGVDKRGGGTFTIPYFEVEKFTILSSPRSFRVYSALSCSVCSLDWAHNSRQH